MNDFKWVEINGVSYAIDDKNQEILILSESGYQRQSFAEVGEETVACIREELEVA